MDFNISRTGERYSSRKIDIDILFYGDEVISTERLQVPHPLIAEREFVLQPLCEILRTKRHPVTGRSAAEMLDELKKRRAAVGPGAEPKRDGCGRKQHES